MSDAREALRKLPAVGRLLAHPTVRGWLDDRPEAWVVSALREVIDECRQHLLTHPDAEAPDEDTVIDSAERRLDQLQQPSLRRVINATGVVLHTGLGRAPLSEAAIEAIGRVARSYCNLELDLAQGGRGQRAAHVSDLLCRVTGAEAATVTNNNAAATLLILNTLAGSPGLSRRRFGNVRHEVIVSRGQLVEIGGSFRLPDIMKASGAKLVEVGTTNRTRLSDYEKAITERTAALLRVHTSNYRIAGFSEEVDICELVSLGRNHDLPVVDDLGSGALMDLGVEVFDHEPQVVPSIAAGADVVCFSGDKLLGGPQAGLILGKKTTVDAIAGNPLMRTYRVDKMTLAALEATLRAYVDPHRARQTIPALRMLHEKDTIIEQRARQIAHRLSDVATVDVARDDSYSGGGTLPDVRIPTWVVRLTPPNNADALCHELRMGEPAIVARVAQDHVIFDCRTIADADIDDLTARLTTMLRNVD